MPSENPDFPAHPTSQIGMIWAQTLHGVIGRDGTMPWNVPEDLRHFRQITENHPVVMGRRTWESFPAAFRPLPDRTNIVVSRTMTASDDAIVVPDFQQGLAAALEADGLDHIWVIGGATLYEQALDVATVVERTLLNMDEDGDTYAPELDDSWHRVSIDPATGWHTSRSGVQYRYERWERPRGHHD